MDKSTLAQNQMSKAGHTLLNQGILFTRGAIDRSRVCPAVISPDRLLIDMACPCTRSRSRNPEETHHRRSIAASSEINFMGCGSAIAHLPTDSAIDK